MTWGLGSNVLPIILLSVKFMIVLLLEKIEKRIYDYNVVEISLQKFSVKTFKAASEKMVLYVSLKIFFVNKLSTHSGKYIMVVYHLQKDSGKLSWKVDGTRLFGSFQRKISGSNGTSEKVVLFFPTEYFKQKFVFHFFKAIFDTSFRPSRSFSDKENWFAQCCKRESGAKFTSPEFCVPFA